GLGLSIAVEDTTLHGGRLDAWGEPEVGSVFRLTLPLRAGGTFAESPLPLAVVRPTMAPAAALATSPPPRPAAPAASPGVVDDDGAEHAGSADESATESATVPSTGSSTAAST